MVSLFCLFGLNCGSFYNASSTCSWGFLGNLPEIQYLGSRERSTRSLLLLIALGTGQRTCLHWAQLLPAWACLFQHSVLQTSCLQGATHICGTASMQYCHCFHLKSTYMCPALFVPQWHTSSKWVKKKKSVGEGWKQGISDAHYSLPTFPKIVLISRCHAGLRCLSRQCWGGWVEEGRWERACSHFSIAGIWKDHW